MSPCEMPGIKKISLTKNNLDDSIIQSVKSSILIDNSPDFLVTPVYRYIDIPVDLNYAIDPFIL